MKKMKKPVVGIKLNLMDGTGENVGHRGSFCKGIALLLRGIADHGALMASTRRIGMAYSKAWLRIRETEEALGVKLIEPHGARGSTLTAQGAFLLERYEQLDRDCTEFATQRFTELFNEKPKKAAAAAAARAATRPKPSPTPRAVPPTPRKYKRKHPHPS